MGDPHTHAVFFECRSLDTEQKKRVEKYFQIRRRSGGGDCGRLHTVSDTLYKIGFRDKTDQERVLQKSQHVVDLPDGPLAFTVQSSPVPSTLSSPTTSTASSPGPSTLSPTTSTASSPGPSTLSPTTSTASSPALRLFATSVESPHLSHEIHLEPYLVRYLKDCPGPWKRLEEELSSVGCCAQLQTEAGSVSVRRSSQASLGVEEVKQWRAELEKVFERVKEYYTCHFEVDNHKVKLLLQSRSETTTDNVRVYSQVEDAVVVAVVVGECSEVQARLRDLEDSQVRRQGSVVSKKRTSTRRVGVAKLRLLWDEIECGLKGFVPGVTVKPGGEGQLVLEGSVGEVLKAGEWISKKEDLVMEKVVAEVSPQLLNLLRKAYGGPGELRDLLAVGAEVEIELGDTELRLFTLSSGKLDDIARALRSEFKEVKVEVPNCSAVPSELRAKLEYRLNELNHGSTHCRVAHRFGSGSIVYLLGHAKEVDELKEVIAQFILDLSNVEGRVILPFTEIADCLPKLLQLNGFDHSGVTIHPLSSSSSPSVVLAGPSSQVTHVRNSLGPLLDSLAREMVNIDLPGALRYLRSPPGRETLQNVGSSHRCLIQLQEDSVSDAGPSQGGTTLASYQLGGLQVLVCQGDLTKVQADALVNAANEDLEHSGGVAAALSRAGGPQVQKESRNLVKQHGQIPTGNVVVTEGGNLKCKVLFHAVGPRAGRVNGMEKVLLEKTVTTALNLAVTMELQSIALPCISSNIFGVPIKVCAEAIVTAVRDFASQKHSLNKVILIDNRGEVVRVLRDASDRLLRWRDMGQGAHGFQRGLTDATAPNEASRATTGGDVSCVQVEIVQGIIETQQVDAMVSPMVSHDPVSTRVGMRLSSLVGPQLTARFHREAGGATLPGDMVLVEGLPGLPCKGVYFLNLCPWDNNPRGTAVQALREGTRSILTSCESKGFVSVAFPVLGTGVALRLPHHLAAKVVLEEIRNHEQNWASRTPFLARIVIHPHDKESAKALQAAQGALHLRGFTNDAQPDKASFYRYVSSTQNEVTSMLGVVKLQLVCGDIIHETSDVIINTTDFSKPLQSGVSKAIVTAAGPSVQAELTQVGVPADRMCSTGPGLLRCKSIIHASFMCEPQTIHKICGKILKTCESKGYRSVSFPAINTGVGLMDFATACKAMLDGMASAVRNLNPNVLSLIRIVILQQPVFQAFRSELGNRFGQIAPSLTLKEKALKVLKKVNLRGSATIQGQDSPPSTPPGPVGPWRPQRAVLCVVGPSSGTLGTSVQRDLEGALQQQLAEREVPAGDFSRLNDMELEAVQAKARSLGVSLELRRAQTREETANGARAGDGGGAGGGTGAGARSGSEGVYVLRGLKEDVLSVNELVDKALKRALQGEVQEREEAILAMEVQWSMQGSDSVWQELSLRANYQLEHSFQEKRDTSVEVEGPDGTKVKVNLRNKEATDLLTGLTYKVKRTETSELPAYWKPMAAGQTFKVELQPSSKEYQDLAQGFLKTANNYTIQKIERVQNYFQWQAYALWMQRIQSKNGEKEVGERMLYHGTSAEACDCIERNKFDRGLAGQHGALYGKGVYFAVNAKYSADRFSPVDRSGLRRLYVARILTGRYTVGNGTMKAPPPRSPADPSDCFDSLVDNLQNPSMFVIFHDDQAYPEYRITFK